jgi:hypothetical protein
VYDLPDPLFDRTGDAIANHMMKPATWIHPGQEPVPARVDFEAPYLAVNALGAQVTSVQAFALGLATQFREAQGDDILVIGPYRWKLQGPPSPTAGVTCAG